MSKTNDVLAREPDPDRLVVKVRDGVLEIDDGAQRRFANALMRLTELGFEMTQADGAEGMAALHGAMMYLAKTKLGPEVASRAEQLALWAETIGLEVL